VPLTITLSDYQYEYAIGLKSSSNLASPLGITLSAIGGVLARWPSVISFYGVLLAGYAMQFGLAPPLAPVYCSPVAC